MYQIQTGLILFTRFLQHIVFLTYYSCISHVELCIRELLHLYKRTCIIKGFA